MLRLKICLLATGMVLGSWSGGVLAQEAAPAAEEPEVSLQYAPPPPPNITYEDHKREDLERKARRSRNALIGTSAAAVVGLPLWIAGGRTQCVKFDDGSGNTQTDCTTAGKVMLGIGYPLAIGGLTGALVSGIILGVRKGKLRDLNKSSAHSRTSRVHWDPVSSQFVF